MEGENDRILAYDFCKEHLFVPEDFSNLQGSHSLVADCSRSPEVGHSQSGLSPTRI